MGTAKTFKITVNPTPTFNTPSVSNTTCGLNNGAITATTNVTGTVNYSINTTPVSNNTTGAFTGLASGSYTITATANGCTATATAIVGHNTFDPTKCYKIVSRLSGKSLEVDNSSLANNASVIQNPYLGTANEKWQFVSVGNGYVKIVAQHSGKVMANTSTNNSSRIFQNSYVAGGSMDWKIECLTAGYVKITHRLSGKALDVKNNVNSSPIIINSFNTASISEQWQIAEVSCTTTNNLVVHNDKVTQTTIQKAAVVGADATSNWNGVNVPAKRGNDFTIYPNPADNEAWVNLTSFEGQAVTLIVTDILGKILHQTVIPEASSEPQRLDTALLTNGLYFIKVQTTKNRMMVHKLQITK